MIKKCFRKAGILYEHSEDVRRIAPTEDPFLDLDDGDKSAINEETQDLTDQLGAKNPRTNDELHVAMADNDLAVYAHWSDEHWEENFLDDICASSSKSPCIQDTQDNSDAHVHVESQSNEGSMNLSLRRFRTYCT